MQRGEEKFGEVMREEARLEIQGKKNQAALASQHGAQADTLTRQLGVIQEKLENLEAGRFTPDEEKQAAQLAIAADPDLAKITKKLDMNRTPAEKAALTAAVAKQLDILRQSKAYQLNQEGSKLIKALEATDRQLQRVASTKGYAEYLQPPAVGAPPPAQPANPPSPPNPKEFVAALGGAGTDRRGGGSVSVLSGNDPIITAENERRRSAAANSLASTRSADYNEALDERAQLGALIGGVRAGSPQAVHTVANPIGGYIPGQPVNPSLQAQTLSELLSREARNKQLVEQRRRAMLGLPPEQVGDAPQETPEQRAVNDRILATVPYSARAMQIRRMRGMPEPGAQPGGTLLQPAALGP